MLFNPELIANIHLAQRILYVFNHLIFIAIQCGRYNTYHNILQKTKKKKNPEGFRNILLVTHTVFPRAEFRTQVL